jgi:hypothetical protein
VILQLGSNLGAHVSLRIREHLSALAVSVEVNEYNDEMMSKKEGKRSLLLALGNCSVANSIIGEQELKDIGEEVTRADKTCYMHYFNHSLYMRAYVPLYMHACIH